MAQQDIHNTESEFAGTATGDQVIIYRNILIAPLADNPNAPFKAKFAGGREEPIGQSNGAGLSYSSRYNYSTVIITAGNFVPFTNTYISDTNITYNASNSSFNIVNTGIYSVTYGIASSPTSSPQDCSLLLDGQIVIGARVSTQTSGSPYIFRPSSVTITLSLTAGQYLQVAPQANNLSLESDNFGVSAFISIQQIA